MFLSRNLVHLKAFVRLWCFLLVIVFLRSFGEASVIILCNLASEETLARLQCFVFDFTLVLKRVW